MQNSSTEADLDDLITDKTLCLEHLLVLNRKICECFAFAGYSRASLSHKSEASIFAFQLGRVSLIPEILNQFSLWPSIDSIHLKYLQHVNITSKCSEALKNLVEICCLGYFFVEELMKMWDKILELSLNNNAHAVFPIIKTYTHKHCHAKQGEVVGVKFNLISYMKICVKFQKIIARYVKDGNYIDLEYGEMVVRPGGNALELQGVAWDNGLFRLESVAGVLNKLMCFFSVRPAYIDVEERDDNVDILINDKEFAITGYKHPVTIQITSIDCELISSEVVMIFDGKLIEIKNTAFLIVLGPCVKAFYELKVEENAIKLPLIPKQCKMFLTVEVCQSCEASCNTCDFFVLCKWSETLKIPHDGAVETHEDVSLIKSVDARTEIFFSPPLEISDVLKTQGENVLLSLKCSNISPYTIELQLCDVAARAIEEPFCLPWTLDKGQTLYLAYILPPTPSFHLNLTYSATRQSITSNPYLNSLINQIFPSSNPSYIQSYISSSTQAISEP